jgi:hypothetical protein
VSPRSDRAAWGILAAGVVVTGVALWPRRAHAERISRTDAKSGTFPSGVPMADVSYSPATWAPLVQQLLGEPAFARINMSFAMEWLTIESGGNPTSIGSPGQTGPDGFPREIGLGQIYNPDDFARMKITPGPFRAYALVSTADETRALAAQYLAAYSAKDSTTMHAIALKMSSRSRALTTDEMDAQVRYTLLLPIAHDMAIADADVIAYGLRAWSAPDYWKLVKAPHALPAILGHGMPAVIKKLDRAPTSWAEFRTVLGMDKNDQWNRALNACEACGNATIQSTRTVS